MADVDVWALAADGREVLVQVTNDTPSTNPEKFETFAALGKRRTNRHLVFVCPVARRETHSQITILPAAEIEQWLATKPEYASLIFGGSLS